MIHLCPPNGPPESPKSNVLSKPTLSGESNKPSVRQNMIFNTSNRGDVSKYYEVLKVLGEGSMGSVSCARKRNEYVGGSAYTKTKKGWFGRVVEERKDAPLEVIGESNMKLYALKSIILSRVSVRSKPMCGP